LTESLSPPFLTIFNDDNTVTVIEDRHFGKFRYVLTFHREADSSTAEEDVHRFVEALRVIYG
jgi:hypothetical protein